MPRKGQAGQRPAKIPANWSRNGEPDIDVAPEILERGIAIMQAHDAQYPTIPACPYCPDGRCVSPVECGRRQRAEQQQARIAQREAELARLWRKFARKNATLY